MFCKQCGKKLEPGLPKCPHCGRVPDALSGGTGFWDLTQLPTPPVQTPPVQTAPTQTVPVQIPVQQPAPAPVPTPAPQPVQPTPAQTPAPPPLVEEVEGVPSRRVSLISVVALALAVLLLLALVVQSVRVGKLENRLEETQAALSAAEAVQEPQAEASAVPETPVPSIAPTPAHQEESPAEEIPAEPTPELPVETAAPESPTAAPQTSVESPALTAQLSQDWETITVKVDDGDLDVEDYEWIVVYDATLETTEDCLQLLDRAAVEEDAALRSDLIAQVDPYDGSSGRKTQRIPVSEFYGDAKSYTKRVFCKMTLEDGSILCSEIISPALRATEDYVKVTAAGGTLTALDFAVPEDMETEEDRITFMFMEYDPTTGGLGQSMAQIQDPDSDALMDCPAEMYPSAELELYQTMEEGLKYYLFMTKNDQRIVVSGPWEIDTALRNVAP